MKAPKPTNNKHLEADKRDSSSWIRSAYIIAFAAMLSIGAYFFVMVSQPDLSQKVLGVFAILSSVYYFVRAIK